MNPGLVDIGPYDIVGEQNFTKVPQQGIALALIGIFVGHDVIRFAIIIN